MYPTKWVVHFSARLKASISPCRFLVLAFALNLPSISSSPRQRTEMDHQYWRVQCKGFIVSCIRSRFLLPSNRKANVHINGRGVFGAAKWLYQIFHCSCSCSDPHLATDSLLAGAHFSTDVWWGCRLAVLNRFQKTACSALQGSDFLCLVISISIQTATN